MKYPLLLPLAAIVCGILAGELFQPQFYLPATLAAIFILVSIFIARYRKVFLLIALFFLGWTNHIYHFSPTFENDLRNLIKDRPSIIAIRGEIAGIPAEKCVKSSPETFISKFNIACQSVLLPGYTNWTDATGKILVMLKSRLPDYLYDGQFIEAKGVIKPPPPEKIYGLFSYQENLKNKYIFYTFEIDSTNDLRTVAGVNGIAKPTVTYRFAKWASRVLIKGIPQEGLNSDLRQAMLFGWKSLLREEINDSFMRSGTMHLFAVSGIHVTILSGAILILLRSLLIPRAICGLVVIPSMWFFVSVTGWQASAIRATIMLTIVVLGWMLYRPSNLLNSIFAAAIIILFWQPAQLFQAGFQLSFLAVLSLALVMPRFKKIYEYLTRGDPFLLAHLQPVSVRMMNPIIVYLGGAIVTTIAAFLGTAPLIAYYFNLVTPINVFANLVVIPLGSFSLVSSLGSLVTAFWCAPLSELFNYSGWFWSKCMVEFTSLCSNLDYGWFYVRKPSLSFIYFYYFILICVLTDIFSKNRLKYFAASVCAIWLIYLTVNIAASARAAEINIVSFLKAHSIYIDSRKNCLIDCGSENEIRGLLEPLFVSRGANKIERFFLTHGDAAHIRGATNLSKIFKLSEIYTGNTRFRSKIFRDAISYFTNNDFNIKFLTAGDRINEYEILFPSEGNRAVAADDAALVLKANFYGYKILFLSDLSPRGIEYLKSSSQNLTADIVVMSKYLIDKKLDAEFLDLVKPKIVVFTETSISSDIPERTLREIESRRIGIETVKPFSGLTLYIDKNGIKIERPRQTLAVYPQLDEL
ncbi:MAG: ComEC/Rec2 family competence protein [Verrucomicrobiia bacterium]